MAAQKDLFDDSTMTFGEHLEVLRVHLWKAIIGLFIGCTVAFFISKDVILATQKPVVAVMEEKFGLQHVIDDTQRTVSEHSAIDSLKHWWTKTFSSAKPAEGSDPAAEKAQANPSLLIEIDAREIAKKLHEAAPEAYPELAATAKPTSISISLDGTPLGQLLNELKIESLKPRTDDVDEAFMIYLKVSLILGVVISSPWILFQLWQFVAAGLYPTERKYVYTYFPFSVGLFLGGALFCFFLVIPQVLGFLFDFNIWLGVRPEIKLSGWITFALMVSLMFGVSFQLPLVMVLLEKISIVSLKLYREKRRWAILIIAIVSMVLTPSDPVSMMMMMIPLCLLYELGIILCASTGQRKNPFGAQPA